MTVTEYPWLEPLQAACALEDEPHLTLLYSGLSEHHTGRYSLLGWGMAEQCTASHWHEIAARLSRDKPWHENAWFGWLGYGMRLDHERLNAATRLHYRYPIPASPVIGTCFASTTSHGASFTSQRNHPICAGKPPQKPEAIAISPGFRAR